MGLERLAAVGPLKVLHCRSFVLLGHLPVLENNDQVGYSTSGSSCVGIKGSCEKVRQRQRTVKKLL